MHTNTPIFQGQANVSQYNIVLVLWQGSIKQYIFYDIRKCSNWIHLSLLWILFFFMSYMKEMEHLVSSSIIVFGKKKFSIFQAY